MTQRSGLIYRDTVRLRLTALSPLHIGVAETEASPDLIQARDGLGRVVLPATSLTGVLRGALGRGEGDGGGTRWWGWQTSTVRRNGRVDSDGLASRVWVTDAVEADSAPCPALAVRDLRPAVRDHVGIDRSTGAAASGFLYTREVIRAGQCFDFELTVVAFGGEPSAENPAPEEAREWLSNATRVLTSAGPDGTCLTVGAGRTRGLGRVSLSVIRRRVEDLSSREGLRAAVLTGGTDTASNPLAPSRTDASLVAGPEGTGQGDDDGQSPCAWSVAPPSSASSNSQPRPTRRRVRLRIPWRPTGPLMSKVSVFGKACDAFPATMTGSDGLRLLLPGSSIKGALRARAEYIARTACGVRAADVGDSLLEQLALASKLPGVRALFGAAGNWPGGDSGCRGALEVPDVTTEVSIPEKEWRAVRYGPLPECPGGENAAFAKAVDRLNSRLNSETHGDGLWFDYVTRNAIDRWSGGVANGQLYSSLEPYAAKVGVWRDIVLDVDMDRLKCNCGQEGDTGNDDGAGVSQDVACQMNVALALLALTVRDLVDGWVPLGFGVTRGLGSVEIEPGNVSLDAQDSPLQGMSLQAGGWLDGDGTANGPVRRLETAWANACEAFRDGPAAARTKAPAAPSGVFVSEERPGT